MNSGPYTLMFEHESKYKMDLKNMINSHIKKLLIEEKDGTGISAMKGLTFLLCKFHSSTEKLKPITMKRLSDLENPPFSLGGDLFITSHSPKANPQNRT